MSTMVGSLIYGGDTIPYEVRFLASRRTLGIEVHPDSRVLVRAPVGCPPSLIAERVRRRADWISRQLAEFERYRPRTPPRQYLGGESHLYLGRQYRMKLLRGDHAAVKLAGGEMCVVLPDEPDPTRVKALVDRWYRARAGIVFGEVLAESLRRFDQADPPRLVVRRMLSRWGSLSPTGTLTLNVQLVRAPRRCIEYVVMHELCHTKHRNHDRHFFRLLGRLMPDWERRKQRLEAALL